MLMDRNPRSSHQALLQRIDFELAELPRQRSMASSARQEEQSTTYYISITCGPSAALVDSVKRPFVVSQRCLRDRELEAKLLLPAARVARGNGSRMFRHELHTKLALQPRFKTRVAAATAVVAPRDTSVRTERHLAQPSFLPLPILHTRPLNNMPCMSGTFSLRLSAPFR